MPADLRRAAEHLAASPNGREFLARIVWPVAVRECPADPWGWVADRADCDRRITINAELARNAAIADAARLLLCRAPRGADDPRHSHNYGLWTADIAAIEAATGARNLARLLRAGGAAQS